MAMISVRVDDDVVPLFDQRAAEAGLPNRSAWCREVLMAAANPPDGVQAHPARALSVQARALGTTSTKDCVHPVTARRDLPFSVLCGVCGVTLRRR